VGGGGLGYDGDSDGDVLLAGWPLAHCRLSTQPSTLSVRTVCGSVWLSQSESVIATVGASSE
jgi:hypothetical protein